MTPTYVLIILLLLSTAGYYLGRKRAMAVVEGIGGPIILHSRPVYYGALTALWCAVPSLFIFSFWLVCESSVITDMVLSTLPESIQSLPADRLSLVMNDIKNLVSGNIVAGKENADLQAAADYYQYLRSLSRGALFVLVILICVGAVSLLQKRIRPELRARNHVEFGRASCRGKV